MFRIHLDVLDQLNSNFNSWKGPSRVFGSLIDDPEPKTLDAWNELGLDQNSLFIDPGFVDAAGGNLELGDLRPVRGVGEVSPYVRDDFVRRKRPPDDPPHLGALQTP